MKHVDRELPGFVEAYNLLSEFAHPNWLGVVALYSKHDPEKFRTKFGRGLAQSVYKLVHALALGLTTLEIGYQLITHALPAFLDELEKL
jgi:hypothetical protein